MKSLLVFGTLLLLAPAVDGHVSETLNDHKTTITFGFLNEPVTTYQRTGLDLGLKDGKGRNITLDAATLAAFNITITRGSYGGGGPALHLKGKVLPQEGRPGWYTYPIVFTEPGNYTLRIDGFYNNTRVTRVDMRSGHEVKVASDQMFPAKVPDLGKQDLRIQQLEADVEDLRVKVARLQPLQEAPGLSAVTAALVLVLVAVLASRRR